MSNATDKTPENGQPVPVGSDALFGSLVIRTVVEALAAAADAQRNDLRGYYPAATIVLAHAYQQRWAELQKSRDLLSKAHDSLKHHGGMGYTGTWLASDIETAVHAAPEASAAHTITLPIADVAKLVRLAQELVRYIEDTDTSATGSIYGIEYADKTIAKIAAQLPQSLPNT